MERLVGFNHDVLRGVRDFAGPARGWICHFIDPRPELLPLVAGWKPDGIVAFIATEAFGHEVMSLGAPMVDVAAWVERPPWPRVGLDDVATGRLAADYLLGLGFEHFAYIGDPHLAFSTARRRGYEAGLSAAGYEFRAFDADPKRFPLARGWTMGGVDGELVAWIDALPKPVALFADNDDRALLVSEACRAGGVEIPGEVALLGVDDDPYLCRLGYPPISSIATPARRLGYEAAVLLDRLLAGFDVPHHPVRLPPQGVVARRSTDVFAYADPVVAEAMRFILAHFTEGIAVPDVAAAVTTSRRTLERRFQQDVGHTVLVEITRARLDRARFLLATTDLPLRAIATQSGFDSASGLSLAHRAAYAASPGEYRRSVVRG